VLVTVRTAVFFSVAMAAQSIQANLYEGSISGVVTATLALGNGTPAMNPWQIGEVITGKYFYQSPTADGTFDGASYPSATLYGDIRIGQMDFSFALPDVSNSRLHVENGTVTFMDLDGEAGSLNYWFYTQNFFLNFQDVFGNGGYYDAYGTLTVSSPSLVSIPDSGSTAVLFGVSLCTLALAARWLKRVAA